MFLHIYNIRFICFIIFYVQVSVCFMFHLIARKFPTGDNKVEIKLNLLFLICMAYFSDVKLIQSLMSEVCKNQMMTSFLGTNCQSDQQVHSIFKKEWFTRFIITAVTLSCMMKGSILASLNEFISTSALI